VTITYDAASERATLYLNGEEASHLDNVPTQRYVYSFWLGGDPYQPSFKGNISDLIIFPKLKDQEEIKKLYKSYG